MKFLSTKLDQKMKNKLTSLMQHNQDREKLATLTKLDQLIVDFNALQDNSSTELRHAMSGRLVSLGKNMRYFKSKNADAQQNYDELACYFYLKAVDVIVGNSFEQQKNQFDFSKVSQGEREIILANLANFLISIELNNADGLKDAGLFGKKKIIQDAYLNFLKNNGNPGERLYPEQLETAITAKNKRNGCFHGVLIRHVDSPYLYAVDPEAVKQLFNEIIKIKTTGQRTQFMFYCNNELGHAIELDVNFNKEKQIFEILCLDSTDLVHQMLLLEALCAAFKQDHVSYKIIACQTNIQKDTFLCPLYTYAFGRETAYLPFELINQPNLFIPHPALFSSEEGNKKGKLLDEVYWIPVSLLPQKIILMGQSREEMKLNLKAKYQNEATANIIFESFMEQFEFDKANYPAYRRQQLVAKNTPSLSDTKSAEKIDQITSKYEKADVTDSTPLHWVMEKGFAFYAIKLIKADSSLAIQNKEGKTPADYYEQSENPALKHNEKLARLIRCKQ